MASPKCPRCARRFVRPLRGTILLRMLKLRRFRCQVCSHRFYALRWNLSPDVSRDDHREYQRMARNFPISFEGGGFAGDGILLDISMGGCSFATDLAPTVGAVLRLRLRVADDIQPVTVDAAVVRHGRAGAPGVEFVRWQATERERMETFIRGVLIDRGIEPVSGSGAVELSAG